MGLFDSYNLEQRIAELIRKKCCCNREEFGLTELSPPVDAPGAGDPDVLFNVDTGIIYYWDGDSWEIANADATDGGQGVSLTGSTIDLGDDSAGTTEPGILTSDRFINQNGKDVVFVGVDDTVQTTFKILPDGSLEFDKPVNDEGSWQYLTIKDLQQDEGNITWNEIIGSTNFPGDTENNFTVSKGFNIAPGGTVEVAGETGWGESWEYHYAPDANVYSEWHRVFYNAAGTENRIESFVIHKTDPTAWYGYNTIGLFSFVDPTNNLPFLTIKRSGTIGSDILMLSSASGSGATWTLDASADQLALVNNGMTNPHLYLFNSDAVSYVHCKYFIYLSSGGAATSIAGQDGSGFLTNVPIDSTLALTAGTLGASGKQAVVTSAAATLTLGAGGFYSFTGTTTTWSLPTIAAGTTGVTYDIKNRGSGNITIDVTGGGTTIYDTAAVTSYTVLPGDAVRIIADATYWNIL